MQMETVAKNRKRRLRFRRAAMKESRKTTKNKDVSLETTTKISHVLVFPITMYAWER